MKKYFTKEVQIALSVIISGIILFAGIEYLKGINIMKPSNYFMIKYKDIRGLTVSSPVTLDGFKIGTVRAVEYDFENPGNVDVEIAVNNKLRVPKGSKAVLSVDILGTASIILDLANNTTYHEKGDQLIGESPTDLLTELTTEVVPQVTGMLPKIDSILTALQGITSNPALQTSINRFDNITANLETSSVYLKRTLQNDVPQVMSDVKSTMGNVGEFSKQLNTLNLNHTMSIVDKTLLDLQGVTTKLNSQDNTLGLLLNNPSLYTGLVKTVGSADSLMIDLKLHPKRYVHFSLFGRKN